MRHSRSDSQLADGYVGSRSPDKETMTIIFAKRISLLAAIALVAATSVSIAATTMPGGDADQHGCRASAGYSWCARTGKCERPWELAKANGFPSTRRAFNRFCNPRR